MLQSNNIVHYQDTLQVVEGRKPGRRACCTSAPVASHSAEMELMDEIRCASMALAVSLVNSADQRLVSRIRSRGTCRHVHRAQSALLLSALPCFRDSVSATRLRLGPGLVLPICKAVRNRQELAGGLHHLSRRASERVCSQMMCTQRAKERHPVRIHVRQARRRLTAALRVLAADQHLLQCSSKRQPVAV